MDAIQTILDARVMEFKPSPFVASVEIEDYFENSPIDEVHHQLIVEYNGFFAFDRALHLFGCSRELPFHDMINRNRPSPWRKMYDESAAGLVFFAEELFGNMFAYAKDGVVFFDLETGEREIVAQNFNGWLRYVIDDIDYVTGWKIAQDWTATHGSVPFGSHLCPKKPFIIGGEYDLNNLYPLNWEKSLSLRADIFSQMRDLPDGTDVELRVDDN